MLTSEGKNHIKRYLAGYVPTIAQSVALGIGAASESVSDAALQLEVAKSPVNLITYDFAANKLIFKAAVPDDYVGKIYEVGIYSMEHDPTNPEFGSRLITSFDSATEDWINPSNQAFAPFVSTNTRVGTDSLSFTPGASSSATYALQDIELDLSGYSAADTFKFAFYVSTANTSAVNINFMTDASNYYTFALGSQTSGYKLAEVAKSTANVSGSPSWGDINEIRVSVTSGGGGASGVEFDAIRVEDKDSASLDYILVARKVLALPVTKIEGQAQDIEFALDVSI